MSQESPLWLVIGLGNPGSEYAATYHNVGYRVIEILAARHGVCLRKMGLVRMGRVGDSVDEVLVQPQTYMNHAGRVLEELYERFGKHSRMLLVSDDLALPIGRIRVRERGSAGGHNGLKSISLAYGSQDYIRVRVGIASEDPIDDAREYVLSQIRKDDRKLLEKAELLAADAVEHIVRQGTQSAMAEYNGVDLSRQL